MNKIAYEKTCINNFSRHLHYVYVPKKRLSPDYIGIPAHPKNLKVFYFNIITTQMSFYFSLRKEMSCECKKLLAY